MRKRVLGEGATAVNIGGLGRFAKWHVTANEVSPPVLKDLWFGYRLYTPTVELACDHGRRQVSWLTARCPLSPSQDQSQWLLKEDSPLTVAGTATALGLSPAPRSLLIPSGEPSIQP